MGERTMDRIEIEPAKLYQGCLLAAIVHAVAVGEYPELNYEHSWDGINYNMNDGQGSRATITFHPKYIVAVFQNRESFGQRKAAMDYFEGASEEIVEIARNEALQYMLEDIDGAAQSVITGAFFGDWKNLFSNQTLDSLMETGGFILENQLMDYQNALVEWDNYYGLNNEQFFLIDDLYKKKVSHGNDAIMLDEREKRYLYGDMEECRKSLRELNIF